VPGSSPTRLRAFAFVVAFVVAFAFALALALVGATGATAGAAQQKPQGLIENSPSASPGYTLYSPLEMQRTYLIDMEGKTVHTWNTSTRPGLSQYLLPNGDLLRTGNLELQNVWKDGKGAGGRVEELDWQGNLLWRFDYADEQHMQHHDIAALPNGDVLMIAWERKTAAEALAAGRSPKLLPDGELWPDTVVQYRPSTGQIVWEWHVWDHLVQDQDPTKANYGDVNQHPEKIDVNYVLEGNNGEKDWNHLNSVAYDAQRDQIILSSRSFSEFWIIDHHTTTAEASGPAGDLLFRSGNPATTKAKGKRTLYVQHDVDRIAAGLPGADDILAFSNGLPKVRPYSSIEEITPTEVDGHYVNNGDGTFAATATQVFPKKGSTKFFAAIISSAQRLPNGDTLMANGPAGTIIEVNEQGKVVWEYENPHYKVRPNTPKASGAGEPILPWWTFRALRYSPDDPAVSQLPASAS
jgi:Arylsulfotransferase (ASST)